MIQLFSKPWLFWTLCPSVCPSVCLTVCSNTIYFLIFGPIWPERIFLETVYQGEGFKTIYSRITSKINFFYMEQLFSKPLLFQTLCPSVCCSVSLTVCSNTIYFFIFGPIWPERIVLETVKQGEGFKTHYSRITSKMNFFSYDPNFFKTIVVPNLMSFCLSLCFIRLIQTGKNTFYSINFTQRKF